MTKLTMDSELFPSYDIFLSDSYQELSDVLISLGLSGQKVCVVSDSNVSPLYGDSLQALLKNAGFDCYSFTFPAGEESKNLGTVENLYRYLIENSFNRKDFLIALGGGVTGDLTGFVAATYLRGIRYVGLPTSLLSMVDSSIGGKTGVDFEAYKNMVGAFYQPNAVFLNIRALDTLPKRQFLSGMGEVVKHAFIRDSKYFEFLRENRELILSHDFDVLSEMIYRSLCIKKEIVQKDPTEKGDRAFLNFGHTIGHAIEKLSDFSLMHGECVAAGCIAAAMISVVHGTLSVEDAQKIRQLILDFGLVSKVPNTDLAKLTEVCHHDKKADKNAIRFVLLRGIGNAYTDLSVTDEEIKSAFLRIVQ